MATTNKRFVAKNGLDNNNQTITNIGAAGTSLGLSGTGDLTIAISGTATLTIPSGSDTLVTLAGVQTLTNKTLTTPIIAEIDNASDITLDAGGDIILDADGADIFLKDGGTTFGALSQSGGELLIKSGTTPTTALTLSGENVVVSGNLTVSGTTFTVNSNTVNIGDNIITLNSDETGTPSQDGGIEIERGTSTNVSLLWDEANDRWTVGSQNFVAGTFIGALNGNASTVTNGVYITDTGTVTNTMLAGSIANNKLVNSTISGVALGSNLATLTMGVSGTGLSGSQTYNGSGATTFTVTSNATSANTSSTIVARDASGNFTAGTITAALSGNATTATTLQTARTINGVSFNGSADITVTAAAGTLSGTTLASGVTASSLTSVGTLSSLTVSGTTGLATTGSAIAGVGSTTVGTKFTVQAAAGGQSLRLTDATNSTLQIDHPSSGVTRFRNGADAEWMRESSKNVAFNTNTLFVDAANNRVGVGTASPAARLEVASGNQFFSTTSTTANTTLASIGVYHASYPSANQFASIDFLNGPTNWFAGSAIVFKTNGSADTTANPATEKMRLDGSGNLGLGVTPSAWGSGRTALQIGNDNSYVVGRRNSVFGNNAFNDGSWKYITNYTAQLYVMPETGEHIWYNAASGTAGNAITFTERMRIDASGNLGVGTTSPTVYGAGYRTISANGTSSGVFEIRANDVVRGLIVGDATDLQIQANGATPMRLFTNSTERARIDASGNFGIGTTAPAYKLDVNGKLRTLGILNSTDITEIMVGAVVFANNEANRAFDIRFGNTSFWGYLEVEITSTFNFQNSPGKLTKIFSVGTNPNNLIYSNESRIVDAMGPITSNIAIGEFGWDAANSTYRIPVSHIVSTGNMFSVRVKMFSLGNGAQTVFDNISLSSVYTLTALSRHYPYYNERLGIGTASPANTLHVNGSIINSANIFSTGDQGIILGNQHRLAFDDSGVRSWGVKATGGLLQFFSGDGAGAFTFNNANVGIGTTSPIFALSVAGTIQALGAGTDSVAGGPASVYLGNGTAGTMLRHTAGRHFAIDTYNSSNTWIERIRVERDGNVGIGTTSPSEKLHVIGNILASANITAYSDARIKKNVTTIENALHKVMQLRGVSYTRIDNDEKNIGVIAQEVLEVLPEVVLGSEETQYSVSYGNITALLIEAIKELKKENELLTSRINNITGESQ